MANQTKVFNVHTTDFNQLDYSGQYGTVANLVPFFANNGSMRTLSYSFPWRAKKWKQERGKIAQRVKHTWQRRGFQEEIRLGERLAQGQSLHTISHYLIIPNTPLEAGNLATWGIVARESDPPIPLSGEYIDAVDHLIPVHKGTSQRDASRPYATVLASYGLKEEWDWQRPLSALLNDATGPMIICVDIKKVSQKAAELAVNGLQASASNITKISDKDAVVRLQAGEFIVTQLAQGNGLHHVSIYIMLLDTDLNRLMKERVLNVKTKLSPYMAVETLKGYQRGGAMMFSPDFRKMSGEVPAAAHNVLSDGVAMMIGGMWGFSSYDKYEGIYVGARRSVTGRFTGLHYLDLWQGQQAAHMGIFGQTGSGKTVAVQALLAREIERGTQVIFMEPQGHSRRLAKLIGPQNCAYTEVSYGMKFNCLDVVERDFSEQTDYFIAVLELMLNPRGNDPGRPSRYLSNSEIAAVSEALKKTYYGYDMDELMADQSKTPTLEIFTARLKQVAGGEDLATELERLYVKGPWAETFNQPSSVNMKLRKPDGSLFPAVIFDMSKVPENRITFFYFAILAGVNREIRKSVPYGEKRPERLFVFDEAHYLMSGSNLAAWLAKQYKTARTFRTGFWVIDQDPMTLIGLRSDGGAMLGSKGHDAMSGLYMLNNMPYIMSLHLSLDASRGLAEIHREFLPSHLDYLAHSGPGQAVIKADNQVHIVDFVLRPSEHRALLGS